MLKLELTEKQKEQLKDYFEAVRRGNKRGVCSAIVAQNRNRNRRRCKRRCFDAQLRVRQQFCHLTAD